MEQPRRRLSAVWFADIVGYTELSSRDEPSALRLVADLQSLARAIVEREFEGRVVKFIGDAVLAEFSSTESAVRAAVALQERYVEAAQAGNQHSELRIGVHLGEVTATPDGDLYGDGINTAARLQNEAAPGQIIISEDGWRQLRQRPEFRFSSLGSVELKGLSARVQIYDVLFGARAALAAGTHGAAGVRRPGRRTLLAAGIIIALVGVVGMLARRPQRVAAPTVDAAPAVSTPVSAPVSRQQPVPETVRVAVPETVRVAQPAPTAVKKKDPADPLRERPAVSQPAVAPDSSVFEGARDAVRELLDKFARSLMSETPGLYLREIYPAIAPMQARMFTGVRQQFGPDVQVRFGGVKNRQIRGDTLDLSFFVVASGSSRGETPIPFNASIVRTAAGAHFTTIRRDFGERPN